MRLDAEFLSGKVTESTFYDQMTGAEKSAQWVVDVTVMDIETDEKYEVQITEGLPLLEDLKERKRNGASLDELRQLAAELEAQLPARHTPMQLLVLRLKGKQVAFLKFVCRLVAVGAPV